jgi:hypothetical protein
LRGTQTVAAPNKKLMPHFVASPALAFLATKERVEELQEFSLMPPISKLPTYYSMCQHLTIITHVYFSVAVSGQAAPTSGKTFIVEKSKLGELGMESKRSLHQFAARREGDPV